MSSKPEFASACAAKAAGDAGADHGRGFSAPPEELHEPLRDHA
jgi:hypothetical protein